MWVLIETSKPTTKKTNLIINPILNAKFQQSQESWGRGVDFELNPPYLQAIIYWLLKVK